MARPPSKGTGPQPSEPGSGVTPTGRWVNQQLAGLSLPEETMRSMSSSLLSHLAMTSPVDVFDGSGEFMGTKAGPFQIRSGADRNSLVQDLRRLDAACAHAEQAPVAHEVAKLMVRTKSRAQGDGEARFMAEVMVEDLRAYPLDVVQFACQYWIEGGREAKFTPSWPELKEICDKRLEGRLRLRKAIVHALSEGVGA